jgi:hypothetical protein
MIAGSMTAAIVGAMTANVTTFAVRTLDKIDLFGVNAAERMEAI